MDVYQSNVVPFKIVVANQCIIYTLSYSIFSGPSAKSMHDLQVCFQFLALYASGSALIQFSGGGMNRRG
jgi:hypothetical protein